MENDKYTIDRLETVIKGGLTVGDCLMLMKDGSVSSVNGPYCSWPKAEARYFKVSYEDRKK